MSEPSAEGLKQVACEPRTRISKEARTAPTNDAILAMRVSGGYSDGEFFRFNSALNCVVGQNYAGKSAVFDFIRFGLGMEDSADPDMRGRLLNRLQGILGSGGSVELFVRVGGNLYAVKRAFNPQNSGSGLTSSICCLDRPITYRFDPQTDSLVPTMDFHFPVEVYEQGRISRLRDDVGRQLEMLDEFAGLGELKGRRSVLIRELASSAETLAPLYEEREQLKGVIANLSQFQEECVEKEKLMPGAEEQRWTNALKWVNAAEAVEAELCEAVENIPINPLDGERTTDLEKLFGQTLADFDRNEVSQPALLSDWRKVVQNALEKIVAARKAIVDAVEVLKPDTKKLRKTWREAHSAHKGHTQHDTAEVRGRVATGTHRSRGAPPDSD